MSAVSNTGTRDRHGLRIGDGATELEKIRKRMVQLEEGLAQCRQELSLQSERLRDRNHNVKFDAGEERLSTMEERLLGLEEKKINEVSIMGHRFGGPRDCETFLRTKMDFENNGIMVVHDMVSLVHMAPLDGATYEMEDLLNRDDKAGKGGFSDVSAAALYVSLQHAIPKPFAAGKTSTYPLPRVDKFDKWDKRDGEQGVRYEITRGVDTSVETIESLMRSQLGPHPEALNLFHRLLSDAKGQWAALAQFLSDRRGICIAQCDDEAAAWLYPCEVVKGLFNELYKVRNAGSVRSNIKKLTIKDASRMMWGALQCHKLMSDFVSHKFVGHPLLASYSLTYLFRNRLTPKHTEAMKGKLEKLQRDLNSLTSKVNKK